MKKTKAEPKLIISSRKLLKLLGTIDRRLGTIDRRSSRLLTEIADDYDRLEYAMKLRGTLIAERLTEIEVHLGIKPQSELLKYTGGENENQGQAQK